jgi:hypothetical protein
MLASSYTEVQVDSAGHRMHEAGYFTGIAEHAGGEWRFRDAHWSLAPGVAPGP